MTKQYLTPRKVLRKSHLRLKIDIEQFNSFKNDLLTLNTLIDDTKDEEFNKNHIRDFLKNTLYNQYLINTKDKNDLAIYSNNKSTSDISVLIETKRPNDTVGMVSISNLNKKSLHQLILYYFRERVLKKDINIDIKHLIITDGYKWFVFNANDFEKRFVKHNKFKRLYENFEVNPDLFSSLGTSGFYDDAKILIEQNDLLKDLNYVYFNIQEYKKENNDSKIVSLLKLLSPVHLLKQKIQNDNNTLNRKFYDELLYIIGLEEIKQNGKKLIQLREKNNTSSIMQNTINQLKSSGRLQNITLSNYGKTEDEQLFSIALELCITWINRILFLKLLEAKLLTIHQGNFNKFLSSNIIDDFDKLNYLFFEVLAKKEESRDNTNLIEEFQNIPYLNSSLFEQIDLEIKTVQINALRNDLYMKPISSTVLKNEKDKKETKELNSLTYLLDFLNSYNFGQYDKDEISNDKKTLINASVLGLIFEKLNGYKDGSFYTPSFVTMYMSRETIRAKVVDKFNEYYSWDCKNFEELEDKDYDRDIANRLINSITICDPAVGSGHFLVSALNELLLIKSELKILEDENKKRIKNYIVEIENDELFILDEDNEIFDYTLTSKGNIKDELQKIQKTIFEEKRKIIENQLFGVDLNPNSVKICSLRLWIELLKSTYYDENMKLVTLPNIDINIKCGNSLISRYDLEDKIRVKNIKDEIQNYKKIVKSYKHDKHISRAELKQSIDKLKNMFKISLKDNGKLNQKKQKLLLEYKNEFGVDEKFQKLGDDLTLEMIKLKSGQQQSLFSDEKIKKDKIKLQNKLLKSIKEIRKKITEYEENKIYDNAFEWRFEFPEVLDEDGNFIGFDIVIGNPPYIRQEELKEFKNYFESKYKVYTGLNDIYTYFYELSFNILKQQGIKAFICSDKFFRASYGEPLRKFILDNFKINIIVDFSGRKVFDEATVDTSITIFKKQDNKNNTVKIVNKDLTNSFELEQNLIDSKSFVLSSKEEITLTKKIHTIGKELKYWDIIIYRGILTGFNDAFIIDEDKYKELIQADSKNKEIIKPILRGRDIKKYQYNFANKYLINTFNGYFVDKGEPRDGIIDVQNDYPIIFEHLQKYQKQLEKRSDKGEYWTNLRNCAYDYEFYNEKLIYPETTQSPNAFVYLDKVFYLDKTAFMVVGKNLKYINAILNSSVLNYYMKNNIRIVGQGYQLSKIFVENLPIPNIPYIKPYKQNINHLISLSSNQKYNRANKFAVIQIEGKDFYINEFLFAKQRGYIRNYKGHTELNIAFFTLLPFLSKEIYIKLKNSDDNRISYGINLDDKRTLLIVTDDDMIISIFIQNNKNLNKQINNGRFIKINKENQFGETTTPLTLNCPAGSCPKTFWRQTDLIEQLYHILEKNTISQDIFIKIVDKILNKKVLNKNTKYLERLIDKKVYKLYNLTSREIEIVTKQ